MKKDEKTNAVRQLEAKKLDFLLHEYESPTAFTGVEIAAMLQKDPAGVFKTLVTVGKTGSHYVFMVPAAEELDLKKAAVAVGEKNIAMIRQSELLPLTGYIHGGCSPIGMKKRFPTVIHESAGSLERILFSGGRWGLQIEIAPAGLAALVPFTYADIIVKK